MKSIIFVLISVGLTQTYAQDNFYFKKWKAKGQIIAEKVVLQMDSIDSPQGVEFNKKLGKMIAERLNQHGIPCILYTPTNRE